MALKSRNMQIPGGFKFYQPEIKWQSPNWGSFDTIVRAVMSARQAHPQMVQKYSWKTDYNSVAEEVDAFNSKLCMQMGWTHFLAEGGQPPPPPFYPSPPPDQQKNLAAVAVEVKTIWAGVRTLNEWLDSGEPAVSQELANKRAAVCAACTKNVKGDFSAWFTRPASEAIRKQLERVQDRKLGTPDSDKLNVCEICYCPMKLKVFTPFPFIKKYLSDEILNKLRQVPGCWIPQEHNG